MVAPITGPFTKIIEHKSAFGQLGDIPAANLGKNVWKIERRTSYRQKRPYNLPLPFKYNKRALVAFERTTLKPSSGWSYESYVGAPAGSVFSQTAYNAAYASFVSSLGTKVSGLTSLIEMRQSVTMIEKRAFQLRVFYRALKKLDFTGAAAALGVLQPPVAKYVKRQYSEGLAAARKRRGLIARRNSRALANNVLEFNFGWAPLAKDIGDSVEILLGGVPQVLVRGFGRHEDSSFEKKRTTGTRTYTDKVFTTDSKYSCRIQALVSVDNPNAWLANQMGFVNPAATFWEAAPWSFLVDWVSNVGNVINSWTDFTGLKIQNACVTYAQTLNTQESSRSYYMDFWGKVTDHLFINKRFQTFTLERTVGTIPYPRFEIKPLGRISVTRAVNAISLLVQQLKEK